MKASTLLVTMVLLSFVLVMAGSAVVAAVTPAPTHPGNHQVVAKTAAEHQAAAQHAKKMATYHKGMAAHHESMAAEHKKLGHTKLAAHHKTIAMHHRALAKEHEAMAKTHMEHAKKAPK